MSIGRKELKFYLNRFDAKILKAQLARVMVQDDNSVGTNGYFIRSLYFDSFDNRDYRHKVAGVEPREKFRIRYYNFDTQHLKFEIKSKRGDRIFKQSQNISVEVCNGIVDHNRFPQDQSIFLKNIEQHFHRYGYSPKVTVDYYRDAYVLKGSSLRITFDEHVTAMPGSRGFFSDFPSPLSAIDSNLCILEVKYDRFLPSFAQTILNSHNLTRLSISKYSHARLHALS